ncbi:MAG: hypothetical protein WD079_02370, partial [Phycisphaeraceae bacterium]
SEYQRDRAREQLDTISGELSAKTEALQAASDEHETLMAKRGGLRQEVAELEAMAQRQKQLDQDVRELAERRANLDESVSAGEARHERLTTDLSELSEQIANGRASLEELERHVQAVTDERNTLKAEVADLTELSKTHGELKRTVGELSQRQERLVSEVAAAEFKLSQKQDEHGAISEKLEKASGSLNEVRDRVEQLTQQRAELGAGVSELTVQSESRSEQVAELAERLAGHQRELNETKAALDADRKSYRQMSEEVEGLIARRGQLEQTIAVLEETLKEMRLQAGYRGSNAGPLSELWKPALVKSEFVGPRDEDESSCLAHVTQYMKDLGLIFPQRLLHAFHTAVKVNEVSPLVVLAGISGTGKSELARRYSEAMGMHFLNLAVQPRWDSPQDMFGFFNYLENQ